MICGLLFLVVALLVIALVELADRYQRVVTSWRAMLDSYEQLDIGFHALQRETARKRDLESRE